MSWELCKCDVWYTVVLFTDQGMLLSVWSQCLREQQGGQISRAKPLNGDKVAMGCEMVRFEHSHEITIITVMAETLTLILQHQLHSKRF